MESEISENKERKNRRRLTASILVAVVTTVIVSVTPPLLWDAGALTQATD